MTAHKYAPGKVSYPCFVQPKLNGVRGIYIPGTTGNAPNQETRFQSRYGEVWNAPVIAHSLSALTGLSFHLDGEFYLHGMSLQNINSRIGVVRNLPHAESTLIDFCIFDVMLDMPFHRRLLVLNRLKEKLADKTGVRVVKTEEVSSPVEADFWYNKWKNEENFEGMMYRDANAVYGFAHRCGNKDNRWNYLLKRKEMMDAIGTIVGFNEMICGTTGQPKGTLGSFEITTDAGARFSAGSGLTNELRAKYWAIGEEQMAGTRVSYSYEMLSDSGVPLKPIIDLVHYI